MTTILGALLMMVLAYFGFIFAYLMFALGFVLIMVLVCLPFILAGVGIELLKQHLDRGEK